jgi:prolyl-tRNA synthetase
MKLSQGFWQTYKETPAEAEIPSHRLMVRAGFIHKTGSGLYSYLPMGYRVVRKIENIVREEMDKAGCYEIAMSVVTPAELWKETGRWDKMGDLMLRFKDKAQRELCMSPTNEESVTDIFRKTVFSYKQLPVTLYQINTKFRDEIRPRFGLMRAREFTMKDAYSFHVDKASLDKTYNDLYQAYTNVFNRLGLEFVAVEADAGAIGTSESKTHEFQVIADTGEDFIIYSKETGYAANIEKAQTKRAALITDTKEQNLEKVSTPDQGTIEEVCSFLKVEQSTSIKSLVYKLIFGTKEKFALILMLGDDSLNEVKLINHTGADHILPATENELAELGFVKGFIGPVGLTAKVITIYDQAINKDAFYVVGGNEKDIHLKGFKPSRDIGEIKQADLRMAKAGDLTLDGKGVVEVKKGIEVGHVFQLGDMYTKGMKVTVLDVNGKAITPLMGCYGIGVTRVMAAAIEQNHDESGIIWPYAIAPYEIYFATIGKTDEFNALADGLHKEIVGAGFEVLYDDRNASPGFKFKDADLLGLPIRVTLGERDYEADGTLEVTVRKTGEKTKVKKENLISFLNELKGKLK